MGLTSAIASVRRLRELRGAYRRVFLGQDGKPTEDGRIVLAELRYFCHGDRPTLKTNMSGIDAHASVEERRQLHREALASSKVEIQRIGALHKAAGWSDPGLKAQLQSQAQVYAAHHRALAALA